MLKITNPTTRRWREINKEYYKDYMRKYMNNYRHNIKLKIGTLKKKKLDNTKSKFKIIKKNIIIEF